MTDTAKFSAQWTPFLVSSIWQATQSQNPPEWRSNTNYSAGSQVTSNGYTFVARNGGISGKFQPVFLSGSQSFQDNTIEWLRVKKATETLEHSSNLYLTIGKNTQWDDEESPSPVVFNDESIKGTKKLISNLFRIQRRNFSFGLKINEWVSGNVFDQYDTINEEITENSYVTIQGKIFKCIDNNNGSESTVQPFESNSGVITLSDGYVWKFMGSVPEIDIFNFGTDEYIPVRPQNAEGTDQWEVQFGAKEGEISSFRRPYYWDGEGVNPTAIIEPSVLLIGKEEFPSNIIPAKIATRFEGNTLSQVYVDELPGANYPDHVWAIVFDGIKYETTSAVNIVDGEIRSVVLAVPDFGPSARIFIIGDGTGATASASIVNTVDIGGIEVVNGGSGYTWARVIAVSGTNAWIAKAIMAPASGHGKNIVEELPINTLLFSFKITDEYSEYLGATNNDPVQFRQVCLIAAVQPKVGSARNANAYIGPAHSEFSNNQTSLNKYNENSGYILYQNNTTLINHYPGREELFKIAITL